MQRNGHARTGLPAPRPTAHADRGFDAAPETRLSPGRAGRGITEYQARPPLLTEETRHAVLGLMVAGHTDAAIAKRLGMSTRTVSTHIKKPSELFNSHSRAQLAYLLAQSGILEDIPA
ncbi:response regulator transcription factor [Streptomyces violascens]|uniref:HTH luxR-type domain-containing protein n=1 Tax=Streptomyces violascens TaxID=67381 RepID=A0ABQ3QQ73_9ACTN|nr:helix-turn-helix transcriptional regulator [Streptomyces violascens]GGU23428.1 hypothetical protein GCM10010289_51130 [Streptomyces violascens]GHI39417.1 hypothetical protein Sviol_38250 [Streptomyces violascens]